MLVVVPGCGDIFFNREMEANYGKMDELNSWNPVGRNIEGCKKLDAGMEVDIQQGSNQSHNGTNQIKEQTTNKGRTGQSPNLNRPQMFMFAIKTMNFRYFAENIFKMKSV